MPVVTTSRVLLHFVGDVVDIRRPTDKGVEDLILHKNLRRGRSIGRPFEIDFGGIDAGIDRAAT